MPLFTRTNVLAASLLSLISLPALAVPTLVASETTVQTNTADHQATVTVQLAANTIAGFDFEMTYNAAHLTATTADITVVDPAGAGAGVVCQILAAGTVTCFGSHPTATYPGNVTINIAFDVGATEVPSPGSPLAFTSSNFADGAATPVATSPAPDDGAVVITGGPPPPTPPTITGVAVPSVPASPFIGQTRQVGTIDFSITAPAANGGTGSVTCVDDAGGPTLTIAPANQTGITTTVADPTVSCLITNAAQAGSVTCTAVNGGAQTFNFTCPLGTAAPAPVAAILVPASSLWSKIGLAALLAALGLVFVALRRNH